MTISLIYLIEKGRKKEGTQDTYNLFVFKTHINSEIKLALYSRKEVLRHLSQTYQISNETNLSRTHKEKENFKYDLCKNDFTS